MWITPNQLYDTVDQIKEYVDNNSGGSVDPELESKVESNTANISVLQSAVNAQGTTITNQQTRITQNVAAIESLETEVEDQKTLLEGATTTIGQLGTEVNDLSGSVASVEADTTSLSNAVGQLSTSLGETNTTVQGISEDVTTIQNDVNALTATTSNLETLVNQLVARGALEQTALWTGSVSEINVNQSIAGNVADYDYLYIEGEGNTGDETFTGTAVMSQFIKIESNFTVIRVPMSYTSVATSPTASWYNKEMVVQIDLTQNTFNIVSNNTNETNKNTITKLVGWKLGGSIIGGGSGSSGITEKVLFSGQADTVGTTYNFTEDISGYDYLYVKGNIGASSSPYIYTSISKITDLLDSSGNYTGNMSLMMNSYSSSNSSIIAKRTAIQLISSLSFKVTGFYDSTSPSSYIIPTEIIGWKFNSGNGGTSDNSINYSTEEKEIGTWIDGSKLYQKVIKLENLPTTVTTQQFSTDINNANICFVDKGFVCINDNSFLPLEWSNSDSSSAEISTLQWKMSIVVSNGTPIIYYVNGTQTSSNRYVILVLNYTKTTPPSPIIPEKPASLEAASWTEIANISNAAKAGTIDITDYFNLGDTKTMALTNGLNVTTEIVGFNHDDLSDGSGKAPITFRCKNCCLAVSNHYDDDVNYANGYVGSGIETKINAVLDTMPTELSSNIKAVNKICSNNKNADTVETASLKTWLFSASELFENYELTVSDVEIFVAEGTHYSYINVDHLPITVRGDGSNATYLLRSRGTKTSTINTNISGLVNATGTLTYTTMGNSGWDCVGFCI